VKVALLADIHGNSTALAPVLAAAARDGVEHFLIAGDFTGYYYDAEAVLGALDALPVTAVRGNHDRLLAAPAEHLAATRPRYGSAGMLARGLPPRRLEALLGLPDRRSLTLGGLSVLLCHGSPWDSDEYIYADSPAGIWNRLADCGADVVVLGHSHHPFVRPAGATLVVNPGSVGQPRDRIPGACWAILDTAARTVELRRETYDPAPVIAACLRHDPDVPYLRSVLTRTT
jgi:putative phosphoesterase